MAATLPLSRGYGLSAAANSGDFNNNGHDIDDWGPNSIPPATNSNVPWDEQVVPALRKKLEIQSQRLSKRINKIEASDGGWTASAIRSKDSAERRDGRALYTDEAIIEQDFQLGVSSNPNKPDIGNGHPHARRHTANKQNSVSSNYLRTNKTSSNAYARTRTISTLESNVSTSSRSESQNEATIRARERARQMAREKALTGVYNGSIATRSNSVRSSTKPSAAVAINSHSPSYYNTPATKLVGSNQQKHTNPTFPSSSPVSASTLTGQPIIHSNDEVQENSTSQPSSRKPTLGQQRVRTQSTPLKQAKQSNIPSQLPQLAPATPKRSGPLKSHASPHQDGQELEIFASRRGGAMSPIHLNNMQTPTGSKAHYSLKKPFHSSPPHQDELDEFGPLGGLMKHERSASPSNSRRSPIHAQPDAFRSLSPDMLNPNVSDLIDTLTVPDQFGVLSKNPPNTPYKSTSTNSWEEEIIPTVARRLQQQRLMADDPRLSKVDALIDTWDRDGLPLSKSEVAMRDKNNQKEDQDEKSKLSDSYSTNNDRQLLTIPSSKPMLTRKQSKSSLKKSLKTTSNSSSSQNHGDQQQQQQDGYEMKQFGDRSLYTSGKETQGQGQADEKEIHPVNNLSLNCQQSSSSQQQQMSPLQTDSNSVPVQKQDDQVVGCCQCTIM